MTNVFRPWAAFVFLLILAFPLAGQRSIRVFATQRMQWQQEEQYPSVRSRRQALDNWVERMRENSFDPSWLAKAATIPVVCHIYFQDPTDSLEESAIRKQLRASSDHFRGSFASGHPAAHRSGTLNLAFCLARDPATGQPAIAYHAIDRPSYPIDSLFNLLPRDRLDSLDSNQYLHLRILQLEHNWAGFAQMPGGRAETDGIVVDSDFFGLRSRESTPYFQGKTLTHLLAGYLGLHELWSAHFPCADDGVADTPIHNAANFGIPEPLHFSMCPNQGLEMTMNFMDAVDDRHMLTFTPQQMERLAILLSSGGPRSGLQLGEAICDPESASEKVPSSQQGAIWVYPNPAKTQIQIQWSQEAEGDCDLQIFSIDGRLARKYRRFGESGENEVSLSLEGLSPGFYVLILRDTQQVHYVPFVLEN